MFDPAADLQSSDPELWASVAAERQRQEDHIELIASENYASPAVMAAQGSVLTNKYAEGYPGKRYYGGCEYVDIAEQLAIDRVKALFGAEYANVQPHSGSQANAAVYLSFLKPGDTILGMSLAHGGHLTHGSHVNFSGKLFNAISYGLADDTELIDYDAVAALAEQHKPKMIVAGASAYSRVIDWQRFSDIAKGVGAYLFVDMAHYAGLVGVAMAKIGVALVSGVLLMVALTRVSPVRWGQIASRLWRPIAAGVLMSLAVQAAHHALFEQVLLSLVSDIIVGAVTFLISVSLLWLLAGRPAGAETALLHAIQQHRRRDH